MVVSFAVRCVSCHGRLRVTDEALIGTIVACPRCGSMVQIEVPDPASAPPPAPAATLPPAAPSRGSATVAPPRPPLVVGSDPVDSQEITRGDLLADDEIAAASGNSANGGFAPADKPRNAPGSRDPHKQNPVDAAGDPNSHADWQTQSNWASESTRKSRQRLLVGIAALGGLVIAGILALWLFGGNNSEAIVAQNSQPATVVEDPTAETDASETVVPSPSSSTDELRADEATSEPTNTGETPPAGATAEPAAEKVDAATGAAIPTDLLPVDVLGTPGTDPRMNPRDDSSAVVPWQPDEPAANPLMDLPPELAAFVDLLDLPGNAPDAPPVTPSELPMDDLVVDQAADAMLDPMLLATPPPEVNIENALKLRVAIQTNGYPLASFVLFCSELTQIPIQIDWFTLDLAGISLSQPVRDPQPGWKSIGSLMEEIGGKAGVVFEKEQTRLLLTLASPDLQAKMESVLAIDDFGGEQASVRALVDRFVDHPDWNEREQLNLRALVTDCVRVARGLQSRLPAQARSHWTIRSNVLQRTGDASDASLEPVSEQWPLVEGGQSGLQLDTAITLAGLLRQTARANQVACVINWDDARQRRLSPGQLVLPYADQPAGKMLAETLAPMGLQARVADEKHWWVGTAATYDRMPLLVIGDELGPQREEILARIREAAARADTLIFIEHDPISDRYLSMMPRFLYRQIPAILSPFSQSPPVE